jgi:DNA-binding beta-propeller fold protein YncE
MRRHMIPLALVAVVAAALPTAASANGVVHPATCVVDTAAHRDGDGCTVARGLANTAFHVVSPDGRNLYATGRDSDAVVALRRNPSTGGLRQLAGAAGCLAENPAAELGCAALPGLDRASGIVVSPDGRHVYVSAVDSDTVVAFARDAQSGALQPAGCLVDEGHAPIPGCTPVPALNGPTTLAISPDGGSVYVAATDGSTVAALVRDGGAGALIYAGCARDAAKLEPAGCAPVAGLGGVRHVTVSPDGRSVYAAGSTSNTVVAFARDAATSLLAGIGCVTDRAAPTMGCTPALGLDYVQFLAVSPEGTHVYASGTDVHAIVTLARDAATGALAPVPEPDGCISDLTDGNGQCAGAVGIALPLGLAITRDGRTLYSGAFGYGSVATFERNTTTGGLAQFGPCWSDGDAYCDRIDGLGRAGFVALTPDERFLGVNAPDGSRITVLARSGEPGVVSVRTRSARARRGRVQLTLTCPRRAAGGCVGQARLGVVRRAIGSVVDISAPRPFDLAPGATATVSIGLRAKALRQLGLGRRFRATALAVSHDPTGENTATSSREVRISR